MRARFAGAIVGLLLVVGAGPARAIGPSFDCGKAGAPLAKLICANPALSLLDLQFAQAYYALRYQVGPAGQPALMREADAFQAIVLQACQIPASGPAPAETPAMTACITAEYQGQRDAWRARLSGPAREEATRPVDQHVALQRDLQALGYLPGTAAIDGVYGTGTRAAIVAWQQAHEVTVTGFLGDSDATTLGHQAARAGAGDNAQGGSTIAEQPASTTVSGQPSENANCRKQVTTPLGTVEIRRNAEPTPRLGGDQNQAWVTKHPYECSESGGEIIVTESGGESAHFVDRAEEALGFRGTYTSNKPTVYKIGESYVVPIDGGPDGNGHADDGVYLAILNALDEPTISPYLGPKASILNTQMIATDTSLSIAIAEWDRVAIHRWLYQNGKIESQETQIPQPLSGFTMLVSGLKDGTTLLRSGQNQLVLQVATRYGELAFHTIHEPFGIENYDEISSLSLGNVELHVPEMAFRGESVDWSDYEGFAPKVFQTGSYDIVITERRIAEALGERFQIVTIGPQHIKFSRFFGTGYSNIIYKQDSDRLYLAIADYVPSCYHLDGDCYKSDGMQVTGVTYRFFVLQDDRITTAGTGGTIVPSEQSGVVDTPTAEEMASATQAAIEATASAARAWYVLTNDGRCVLPPKGSLQVSPANVIQSDRENGLEDEVVVLQTENGEPVAVKVGEPQGNLMSEVYTFFRGQVRCEAYAEQQREGLQGLQ